MGLADKAKHLADEVEGKAKQAVGGATGDRSQQAEGLAQEKEGQLKQAGDKLKDAIS